MKKAKVLKIVNTTLLSIFLIIITMGSIFLVKSKLSGEGVPSFGGYKMMAVLSGSMEPTFDTGSVIIIKEVKPEELKKGDIITFNDVGNPNMFITHRILKVTKQDGQTAFKTKGDNNKASDPEPVLAQNVKGKMVFSAPYVGYAFQFLKTPKGLLFVIVVPGLYIILNEVRKIAVAIKQIESKAGGVKSE